MSDRYQLRRLRRDIAARAPIPSNIIGNAAGTGTGVTSLYKSQEIVLLEPPPLEE